MKLLPRTELTQGNIILALIRLGEASTLSRIAAELSMPPQKVAWHLPRMVRDGLLLEYAHGKRTLYAPQPFLQSRDAIERFYAAFLPCVDPEQFDLRCTGTDAGEVIRANFTMLLTLLKMELPAVTEK